jgi:phosphinothricin acetyltransferase
VIGDSANHASIRLHASCGFRHAGLLPAIGWKHERWLDSVLMVLPLGVGASEPPSPDR